MFLNFLNLVFLDSAFPVIFILVLFAVLNYRQIPLNSIFRFILIFFLITLLFRVLFYMHMDAKYNARYLYTLTLFFIIFSVIGFSEMGEFLQKYISKKIPVLTITRIKIFLILIIGVSCIGKALSSPDYKSYLKEIIQIIRNSEKKTLLIFDGTKDCTRIAYHAGVECFTFESILDKDLKSLDYAVNTIESKKIKTFVLVEKSDNDFKNFFKERKTRFPLKLIKEFKEKHICFSLYEYDVDYDSKLIY